MPTLKDAQIEFDSRLPEDTNPDICPGCDKETTVSKACTGCGYVVPTSQYIWPSVKIRICPRCLRKLAWICDECKYYDGKPTNTVEIIEGVGPYYTCPRCHCANITRAFNRCIDCDVDIRWWMPDLKQEQPEEDARDV